MPTAARIAPGAAGRTALAVRAPPGHAPDLEPILAAGERAFPSLAAALGALNPEEPYRRALTFVRERVRATQSRGAGGYVQSGGGDLAAAAGVAAGEALARGRHR